MAYTNEYVGPRRGARETIDELLSRWEYTKRRAELDGGFIMNIEASTLFLFRVVGIRPREAVDLMRPPREQIAYDATRTRQVAKRDASRT